VLFLPLQQDFYSESHHASPQNSSQIYAYGHQVVLRLSRGSRRLGGKCPMRHPWGKRPKPNLPPTTDVFWWSAGHQSRNLPATSWSPPTDFRATCAISAHYSTLIRHWSLSLINSAPGGRYKCLHVTKRPVDRHLLAVAQLSPR